MNLELLFSICSSVATIGWVLLVFVPRKRWSSTIVAGRAIPLLLSVAYLFLIATHWGDRTGGGGSLNEVAKLFSNPFLLLAGWIHYLAFDLYVGAWEVRDTIQNDMSHWIVVPCLVLTFLFGPIGLLSYFGVRTIGKRLSSIKKI